MLLSDEERDRTLSALLKEIRQLKLILQNEYRDDFEQLQNAELNFKFNPLTKFETSTLRRCDLLIDVYFLTTKEGGRKTPVSSGYRPDMETVFGKNGVELLFFPDNLYPGERGEAEIYLRNSCEIHMGQYKPKDELLFFEGPRLMAVGYVKEVLNPMLLYWNYSLLREEAIRLNIRSVDTPAGYDLTEQLINQFRSFQVTETLFRPETHPQIQLALLYDSTSFRDLMLILKLPELISFPEIRFKVYTNRPTPYKHLKIEFWATDFVRYVSGILLFHPEYYTQNHVRLLLN